jgi:hypothetical protein
MAERTRSERVEPIIIKLDMAAEDSDGHRAGAWGLILMGGRASVVDFLSLRLPVP